LDPASIVGKLRAALDEAESFVARMPTNVLGRLFVKDGQVRSPDLVPGEFGGRGN